jgi:hypothetical protein
MTSMQTSPGQGGRPPNRAQLQELIGSMRVVGRDRTHSRTVFSHPPRCDRACDFHRTRPPPARTHYRRFLLPPNQYPLVYRGRVVL